MMEDDDKLASYCKDKAKLFAERTELAYQAALKVLEADGNVLQKLSQEFAAKKEAWDFAVQQAYLLADKAASLFAERELANEKAKAEERLLKFREDAKSTEEYRSMLSRSERAQQDLELFEKRLKTEVQESTDIWGLHHRLNIEGNRLFETVEQLKDHLRTYVEDYAVRKELQHAQAHALNVVQQAKVLGRNKQQTAAKLQDLVMLFKNDLGIALANQDSKMRKAKVLHAKVVDSLHEFKKSTETLCRLDVAYSSFFSPQNPGFARDIDQLFQSIKVDPPPETATFSKCSQRSPENAFSYMPYQRVPAALISPSYNVNLLVYHDMGTGKTCTLLLALLTLAYQYSQSPVARGRSPPSYAGALVLLQTESPPYAEELKKGCGQDLVAKLPSPPTYEQDNTVWVFRYEDGEVYFKAIFNKVTRKLGVKTDSGWSRDNSPVPDHGAVFVDEAHHLFDSKELTFNPSNHTSSYVKRMKEKPQTKLLFLTGTPTRDSLDSLLKMLDLLRQRDIKKAVEDNLYKGSRSLQYYFKEERSERWIWNEGKRAELKKKVFGYVSFATLENDPRVYPHFGVRMHLPGNVRGGFVLERGQGATLKVIINDHQEVSIAEKAINDSKLVLIKVPGERHKRPNEFYHYSESQHTPPHKWVAISAFIRANLAKKHFIYLPGANMNFSGREGFMNFLVQALDLEFLDWDSFLVSEDDEGAAAKVVTLLSRLKGRRQEKTNTAVYVGKLKGEALELLLAVYNSPENSTGSLIRVIFGAENVKEGIDLYSTHFVHVLKPPSPGGFRQVVRRPLRFCSMRDIDITDWTVTVLLYCSPHQLEEGQKLHLELAAHDPVDQVLEALREVAIDCKLLQKLNKVSCDLEVTGSFSDEDEIVCVDLQSQTSQTLEDQTPGDEVSCTGLLTTRTYSLSDEIVRKVLLDRKDQHEATSGIVIDLEETERALSSNRDMQNDQASFVDQAISEQDTTLETDLSQAQEEERDQPGEERDRGNNVDSSFRDLDADSTWSRNSDAESPADVDELSRGASEGSAEVLRNRNTSVRAREKPLTLLPSISPERTLDILFESNDKRLEKHLLSYLTSKRRRFEVSHPSYIQKLDTESEIFLSFWRERWALQQYIDSSLITLEDENRRPQFQAKVSKLQALLQALKRLFRNYE